MKPTMKELRIHTLRGDIQVCGEGGLSRNGIWTLLFRIYVRGDNPIPEEEFSAVMAEEYAKVEAGRTE